MAICLSDARQLSDEVLEALRLRVLHGCELGFTEADVAELLGVSPETVSRKPDLRRCRPPVSAEVASVRARRPIRPGLSVIARLIRARRRLASPRPVRRREVRHHPRLRWIPAT
jgi:hypothetical protein